MPSSTYDDRLSLTSFLKTTSVLRSYATVLVILFTHERNVCIFNEDVCQARPENFGGYSKTSRRNERQGNEVNPWEKIIPTKRNILIWFAWSFKITLFVLFFYRVDDIHKKLEHELSLFASFIEGVANLRPKDGTVESWCWWNSQSAQVKII